MKGDTTRPYSEKKKDINNFAGVLHQQGKVLLDRDFNDRTAITTNWQDQAGQDVIGAGVAAVPAREFNNFKIQKVNSIDPAKAEIEVTSGRLWADGILLYLEGKASENVIRTALKHPLYAPSTNSSWYAIILEVWRETVNGFQLPDDLIEPALGGIDTTQRLHTAFAFRLLQLPPNKKTCVEVRDHINGILAKSKATLTVTFESTGGGTDECPMEDWSGYTGLEHRNYRIEVAEVNKVSDHMVKWSRCNGGLVGRGEKTFAEGTNTVKTVNVTANLQAILGSGLTEFYLEIVQYNNKSGFWEPTFGANVRLNPENDLEVIDSPYLSKATSDHITGPDGDVFFRLWDGIKTVTDAPINLDDGIVLEFNKSNWANMRPGDYWTFPVRKSGTPQVENFESFQDREPEGIDYHLVPLAIISRNNGSFDLTDCRVPFRSLINQNFCRTFTVGEYGHFTNIADAMEALRRYENGGEILLLPGLHKFNLEINLDNIRITGCGKSTRVEPADESDCIFNIQMARNICLRNMRIMSNVHVVGVPAIVDIVDPSGTSTHMEGFTTDSNGMFSFSLVPQMEGEYIIIVTFEGSVNAHVVGVPAVVDIVDPSGTTHKEGFTTDSNGMFSFSLVPQMEGEYTIIVTFEGSANARKGLAIRTFEAENVVVENNMICGGIQIAGGSEKIVIRNNKIKKGVRAGNGITLGNEYDDSLARSKNLSAFLNDIRIEGNEISAMDLSGIGTACFFSNTDQLEKKDSLLEDKVVEAFYRYGNIISNLVIRQNHIHDCLQTICEIDWVPKNAILEDEMRWRGVGLGAISLLCCYDLSIQNNRIADNGKGVACGIFLKYGEMVEITENRISNSANIDYEFLRSAPNVLKYPSGGIIIELAGAGSSFSYRNNESPSTASLTTFDMPAAQINNNTVHTHYGQALYLGAFGPVTIINNSFRSQFCSIPPIVTPEGLASLFEILPEVPLSGLSRLFAGAVLVFNIGGICNFMNSANCYGQELGPAINAWMGKILAGGNETENADRLFDLTAILANLPGFLSYQVEFLINGNTIFNDNQTSLRGGLAFSSQAIVTVDDLEFIGNQSETVIAMMSLFERQFGIPPANTVLAALTSLRANGNRLKEFVLPRYGEMLAPIAIMTVGNPSTTSGSNNPYGGPYPSPMPSPIPPSSSSHDLFSLITISYILNNTTMNQGDHCIMAISPELIDTPNQMLRCPTRAGSKLVCASVTLEAKDPNEPLPEYIGKDIIDSNGNFSLKWTSQTKVEYTIIGTYAGCAGVQMVGIPVLLSGIDPNGSIFDIGKTTKIDSNGKFSIKWTPHIEGECQIIGWIEK